MNITIDQARALQAVALHGTLQAAAESLNKGHSTLLYLLKTMESHLNLKLLDRSGYRNHLTPAGEIVLKHCERMIDAQEELLRVCEKLRSEWEPSIKLIYDGVIDFQLIGDALRALKKLKSPTEVRILAAHLHEVESRFHEEKADMMVTILPIGEPDISSIRLPPIRMVLVAHKQHPLINSSRKKHSINSLLEHTLVKIRGATMPLGLSTDQMSFDSLLSVNDFFTKKQAILAQVGFGWLPEYLIEKEMERGLLKPVRSELSSKHRLQPYLYHRHQESLGKVGKFLVDQFQSH